MRRTQYILVLLLMVAFPACDMSFELDDSGSELITAAKDGDLETIERLPARGVDINTKDESGRTALFWAVDYGYYDIVEFLVRKRADVNITDSEGWTPLTIARRRGYNDIAQLLEKKGAKE